MFVVFFDLTEPASKKANPVCITARKRHYKLRETGNSAIYNSLISVINQKKKQTFQLSWGILSQVKN